MLVVGVAVWLLSGEIIVGGSDEEKTPPIAKQLANQEQSENLFRVSVREFRASAKEEQLLLRGHTAADAEVLVKAETAGKVVKLPIAKGRKVKKGDLLCLLDAGAREALILQAQADLAQAEADYQASKRLSRQGFSAKLNVNEKKARLDGAMAALKRVRLDLEYTRIKAPFSGIYAEQPVKVGAYLPVGGDCAKVVRLNPIIAIAQVSEKDIEKPKLGMKARVRLISGQVRNGRVRYIAPTADLMTRTFRIEIEVDNPRHRLRSGVTTDISIPLPAQRGQYLSPALLTLNSNGALGVRVITDENKVAFTPVALIDQDPRGVWVSGLPDKVNIITVGQDYVVHGQKVKPVFEQDGPPASGALSQKAGDAVHENAAFAPKE